MQNRKAGRLNQKGGPQSDARTELQGVAGEIAFAKYSNCFPDMKEEPGKYDLLWAYDTVDVKTTHYENGHLEVAITKQKGDVDIYALMVGEFPSYRYAGYAYADEVMVDGNIHEYPNGGKVWRVEQEWLHE